jgi:cephalosporin hydroxylase
MGGNCSFSYPNLAIVLRRTRLSGTFPGDFQVDVTIECTCPRCGAAAQARLEEQTLHTVFFLDLIARTENFGRLKWMGEHIWQNVLDLWTIQETIQEVKPSLLIECGTNRGGSALFYAHLFDLLGQGQVVTVDLEALHAIRHPRVQFLIGSSVSEPIIQEINRVAAGMRGPIMVILDSHHSESHVRQEMETYAPLVTPGSFIMVQDGVIDVLPIFQHDRPGPLPAIHGFLQHHPEFEVDHARCQRFLLTHHPMGWLRRRSD